MGYTLNKLPWSGKANDALQKALEEDRRKFVNTQFGDGFADKVDKVIEEINPGGKLPMLERIKNIFS